MLVNAVPVLQLVRIQEFRVSVTCHSEDFVRLSFPEIDTRMQL
jgi:hypothetical protein